MERRETHAKLAVQRQSPRGKGEGLYLYPAAFMEPTRDSLSFLRRLPTQAHPESETSPKHTLWLLLSLKCPAQGPRFHLGTVGQSG